MVFPFSPSRAHASVPAFPGEYSGTLVSDGYGACEACEKVRDGAVRQQNCRTHTRPNFWLSGAPSAPPRPSQGGSGLRSWYPVETPNGRQRPEGRHNRPRRGGAVPRLLYGLLTAKFRFLADPKWPRRREQPDFEHESLPHDMSPGTPLCRQDLEQKNTMRKFIMVLAFMTVTVPVTVNINFTDAAAAEIHIRSVSAETWKAARVGCVGGGSDRA